MNLSSYLRVFASSWLNTALNSYHGPNLSRLLPLLTFGWLASACPLWGADERASSHPETDPDWKSIPSVRLKAGETGILWRAHAGELGGVVALAPGKVLMGARVEDGPKHNGMDGHAVMRCFDSNTGELLWTTAHAGIENRRFDMGMPIVGKPWIEDGRAWYVSNRGELACVDLESKRDDAFVWKTDLVQELGVYKRGAGDVGSPFPSPLVYGDWVFCVTGEGCRPAGDHGSAPSFVAVYRNTGKIAWSSSAPGANIIHAQWSTPVMAKVEGRMQVIFPGGDGLLYSFRPDTGELLWKLDCNPPEALPWKAEGGKRGQRYEEGKMRLFFMGAPVVHEGMLFVGLNLEPEMHVENGPLLGITLPYAGAAAPAVRWRFQHPGFESTFGSAVVSKGVVYVLGWHSVLFALDEAKGVELWHSRFDDDASPFYASPVVANGKVYVADESGDLFVYAEGREKKCLARYEVEGSGIVHCSPVVDGEFVYFPTFSGGYLLKLRLP